MGLPKKCVLKYSRNGKLTCKTHGQALMYIVYDCTGRIYVHCQVYEDEYIAYCLEKIRRKNLIRVAD
jgi:hypothetical protein